MVSFCRSKKGKSWISTGTVVLVMLAKQAYKKNLPVGRSTQLGDGALLPKSEGRTAAF